MAHLVETLAIFFILLCLTTQFLNDPLTLNAQYFFMPEPQNLLGQGLNALKSKIRFNLIKSLQKLKSY